MDVPRTLRAWFLVHFAVDMAAGLPLLIAPVPVLRLLGWTHVDPIATRLVGAALLAIGGQSLRVRDAGADVYRAMLGLKVIWSLAAAFALFAGIGGGAPPAAWAFLAIFIVFAGVWIHHAIRFRQLAGARDGAAPEPTDEDGAQLGDDGGDDAPTSQASGPPAAPPITGDR